MATKYVIDTHALIWFFEGVSTLGSQAKAILSDIDSELVLPIIALAEACWIVERGRSGVPTVEALLSVLDADPRIAVLPLDRATVEVSLELNSIPEMHDRQIVATALRLREQGYEIALLTRDANIVASGLVPVLW